ncbi:MULTISPECIES: hypothetical protein [Klebsiella pneumoniae complex]|nr:hypothetical protein [Klebsiella pneumoniae]EIX9354652.1 hypothetical protein [Klebsiella pneumoniae]EJI4919590.1 hypothetical protein [Klebsiella pneumoniae]MBN8052696.1 hypothetical protein [Klebsiella pneumoniae]MCC7757930.1 hypothetical protein [Klebsiella pneumoniae]MCM5779261.1 hypothetical protein [Klebsiella pneumoniae]
MPSSIPPGIDGCTYQYLFNSLDFRQQIPCDNIHSLYSEAS